FFSMHTLPSTPIFSLLLFLSTGTAADLALPSFPTRRSSDLRNEDTVAHEIAKQLPYSVAHDYRIRKTVEKVTDESIFHKDNGERSEEHTSELQSRFELVCRLLLEKKKEGRGAADTAWRPATQ